MLQRPKTRLTSNESNGILFMNRFYSHSLFHQSAVWRCITLKSNKTKGKQGFSPVFPIIASVLLAAILIVIWRAAAAGTDPSPPTGSAGDTGQVQAAGEPITCDGFARFSGEYVEDGQNAPVENVAAALVTNRSGRFLDLATLTYDIDGQTATFVVTGLPAGRTAWVLEASGMTMSQGAEFTHVDTITAFRDDAVAETDQITIRFDEGVLTATNNTQQTIEDVFVCYKRLHTDGNFLGGIAYRVDFGTLEPGNSAETIAGHYIEGETEIVRVGWRSE